MSEVEIGGVVTIDDLVELRPSNRGSQGSYEVYRRGRDVLPLRYCGDLASAREFARNLVETGRA